MHVKVGSLKTTKILFVLNAQIDVYLVKILLMNVFNAMELLTLFKKTVLVNVEQDFMSLIQVLPLHVRDALIPA